MSLVGVRPHTKGIHKPRRDYRCDATRLGKQRSYNYVLSNTVSLSPQLFVLLSGSSAMPGTYMFGFAARNLKAAYLITYLISKILNMRFHLFAPLIAIPLLSPSQPQAHRLQHAATMS